MLCEDCGKKNAEVIIKTVINGQATEKHLCRDCAQKLKLPGIQDVLANALGNASANVPDNGPKCPVCGFPFSAFINRGQIGCEKCYDVFKPLLIKSIPSLDGSVPYSGERPDERLIKVRNEINLLIRKMNIAAENEDYETSKSCYETIKSIVMPDTEVNDGEPL